MLNRSSNAVKSWVIVGVGALVLALSAFFILSNFSPDSTIAHGPDAPEGHTDAYHGTGPTEIEHIHYDENGTDPVAKYRSADPEGMSLDWDVMGVDADDFTLQNGVLRFKSPPDYENPTDRARVETDLNRDGDTDDSGEAVTDADMNTYNITIRSIERRAANTGPAKSSMVDVTVVVNNVDEAGTVTLSRLLPEVDATDTEAGIDATLTDPDGAASGTVDWEWSISTVTNPTASVDTHWRVDTTNASDNMYTPVEADETRYVRAKASYTDPQGADKEAIVVSVNPVRKAVAAADNGSPDFQDATAEREVPENAMVGANVGAPVTAREPDSEDILTYSLRAATLDTPATGALATDIDSFAIDQATGQITVKAKLDHEEGSPGTGTGGNGMYIVRVRATDPSGVFDDIDVTITAEDVNEAPSVMGMAELTVNEEDSGAETDAYTALTSNTYTASDVDANDAYNWSVAGADGGLFNLAGGDMRTLTFKTPPDYEMSADANRDNVYKVTVVATDNGNVQGMRTVSITVLNVQEEGEVTLSEMQPSIGAPITAMLTDPDGSVIVSMWQWWRQSKTGDTPPSEETDQRDIGTTTYYKISGAMSDTYTPLATDDARFLMAEATYRDGFGAADQMAMKISDNAVRSDPATNRAPVFDPANVTIEIGEDAPGLTLVGGPVEATDADKDPLKYELGGDDASGPFELVPVDTDGATMGNTAQIRLKAVTDDEVTPPNPLDYEERQGTKRIYRLTVTAKDGTTRTRDPMARVTIMVTDVNEPPTLTGDDTKGYEENGTDAVLTFKAKDPEGAAIDWDVTGRDAGHFTISGGMLRFKMPPDFEMPMSGDAPAGNEYTVTVRATAARASGDMGAAQTVTMGVTVTVTDEDEDGTVTLDRLQPEVDGTDTDTEITASLTDPDNVNPTSMWEWSRSKVKSPRLENDLDWETITGATSDTYLPVAADEGWYLRVKATYDDDTGTDDDTAYVRSANKVRDEVDPDDNGSPDFEDGTDDREVAENAAIDANVGAPVTATTDPDPEDILTYSLNGADVASFTIDQRTAQIMVAAKLDHENGSADNDGDYEVTVTVVDPSGEDDSIDITITATDVNEAPPMPTGQAEYSVAEEDSDPSTSEDFVAFVNLAADVADRTYTSTDEDALDGVNWHLEGVDVAAFVLSTVATGGRSLAFRSPPDYEMPTDQNGDNVYKVTVVAQDNAGLKGMRHVSVMVTNVEENGMVMIDMEQPLLGQALTATLMDPDGGIVTGTTWQWHRSGTASFTPDTNNEIEGATMATYTPVKDEEPDMDGDQGDSGQYLMAVATYMDAVPNDLTTDNAAMKVTANAVRTTAATNVAPMFADDSVTRMVPETAVMGATVGEPVSAMDPDNDTIMYEFDNPSTEVDAAFAVNGMGQITVKAVVDAEDSTKRLLDFEDPNKNRFMVTLKATADEMSDTVEVTIRVTDEDEPPSIPAVLKAGLEITGRTGVDYEENGDMAVQTYQAVGENQEMTRWSLTGDDAGDFNITQSGSEAMLTFRQSPNYEMPADSDMNNVYEITVEADDGTNTATLPVTVMVVNVDEPGVVTLWRDDSEGVGQDVTTATLRVGDVVTGAVQDDPDGGVTNEMWKWYRSNAMDGPFTEITTGMMGDGDKTYTVMEMDAEMYLKVMATYDDNGPGSEPAYVVSAKVVAMDAPMPDMTLLETYDRDGTPGISKAEYLAAADDYFDENIDKPTLLEVADLYFDSESN